MNYQTYLKQILEITIKTQASDLHLSVGHPPVLRINRRLFPLSKEPILNAESCKELAFALMTPSQKEKFLKEYEIDFSYNFENTNRFRVNIFFESGFISSVLRLIPETIKKIEELNLPSALYNFVQSNQGFVIIVGPSSHGKSTTLAAIIEEINHTKQVNIITIEDPIEYVFKDDRSIIEQREVGSDTVSFNKALRSVFREDPDVIMVGEMRDPETISTALTAAETGHMVFTTLHTNSAAQTIHRILDSFPGEQQNQIRAQLSGALLGIVSQRLIPRIKGGLIPACEILFCNAAIANIIRENKIHEIPLVIETSFSEGMISLNRSLAQLVKEGEITIENAFRYSLEPNELKILLK